MTTAVQMEQLQEELTALQQDGVLNPDAVVDWAQAHPESQLHREFNWDDSEAAHQWRLSQARQLILRVKIVIHAPDQTEMKVRRFVSLPSDRTAEGGYRETLTVLSDDQQRAELLRSALAELKTLRRKYSQLKELAAVFSAVDELSEISIAEAV